MTLSHQDVRNILSILDHAEHLESIDLRIGDFQLQARKAGALRPEAGAAAGWAAQQGAGPEPGGAATGGPALEMTSAARSGTTPPAPVDLQPATASALAVSPASTLQSAIPAGQVSVCAPMLGTFYSRPSPDQPPFVSEGTAVQAYDTVGLVEVMKMFNSIKAGVSGTVRRIVAQSGKPVQQGQTLLLIEPTVQV